MLSHTRNRLHLHNSSAFIRRCNPPPLQTQHRQLQLDQYRSSMLKVVRPHLSFQLNRRPRLGCLQMSGPLVEHHQRPALDLAPLGAVMVMAAGPRGQPPSVWLPTMARTLAETAALARKKDSLQMPAPAPEEDSLPISLALLEEEEDLRVFLRRQHHILFRDDLGAATCGQTMSIFKTSGQPNAPRKYKRLTDQQVRRTPTLRLNPRRWTVLATKL